MRDGVDLVELGFGPRFVGVEEIQKNFWNGCGALFSSGESELTPLGWPLSFPGGAGSTSCTANQRLANVIRVFHTMRECVYPAEPGFRLQLVGVVVYGNISQTDMGPYPLVCGAASMSKPQTISDKPLGLGFSHRAGRCRPGR